MNNLSIINQQELDYLKGTKECIFINFDYEYSTKIIPFYNKIKEKQKLINFFYQLTSINIRTEDLLGKLHLILLQILIDEQEKQSNIIIINSIGFSQDSLQFLINNLNKILNHFENKNIYILENSSNEGMIFNYSSS
ncbi:hypothetical protein M2347_004184 [Chryseobacterium sp. H1D6B]|uniref:hypothetical protein n=1 Tax=Chryseobacterium sp. H1D6B TaxID=2940588 RepID=UPI0015C78313|nr:hypothetical protein [Chryseobacterium sp. H1D6B]MDH6254457.1 hypothetical protein [Chryseobacterium sp. H1D6B]